MFADFTYCIQFSWMRLWMVHSSNWMDEWWFGWSELVVNGSRQAGIRIHFTAPIYRSIHFHPTTNVGIIRMWCQCKTDTTTEKFWECQFRKYFLKYRTTVESFEAAVWWNTLVRENNAVWFPNKQPASILGALLNKFHTISYCNAGLSSNFKRLDLN